MRIAQRTDVKISPWHLSYSRRQTCSCSPLGLCSALPFMPRSLEGKQGKLYRTTCEVGRAWVSSHFYGQDSKRLSDEPGIFHCTRMHTHVHSTLARPGWLSPALCTVQAPLWLSGGQAKEEKVREDKTVYHPQSQVSSPWVCAYYKVLSSCLWWKTHSCHL